LAIMFALISLFNRNIGVDLYSRLAWENLYFIESRAVFKWFKKLLCLKIKINLKKIGFYT
jgi:hypothetical protein